MNQQIHVLAFFKNTKFKNSAFYVYIIKYPFYQISKLRVR